jgi:hypothetical protein
MGNVSNVKETYTMQEWKGREQYYVQEVGKINLPVDPNTKDIMRLEAAIDSLLTEAMLDLAYIRRRYQYLDAQMKLAEKETFSILKQNPPSGLTNTKLTENDIKGFVVKYLKSHPIIPNSKIDIYTMVQATEERLLFIEMVVKMLTEKKGALVTDNGMLKIEASVSGGNATP